MNVWNWCNRCFATLRGKRLCWVGETRDPIDVAYESILQLPSSSERNKVLRAIAQLKETQP